MIAFDKSEFNRQMHISIKKNLPRFVEQLKMYMRIWIESNVDFKSAKVFMADGSTTSDLQRAEIFLNSLGHTFLDSWISNSVYAITLQHMDRYDEDYIGWYYEFGTGTLEDIGHYDYTELEDKNPYRTGRTIVTRSIKETGGLWRDAGGSLRKTKSKVGGINTPSFMRAIGGETKAYHWSTKSLEYALSRIGNDRVGNLCRDIDVSKCIIIPKKITLGG